MEGKKQKSIKINFVMNVMLTMSSLLFQLITFPYASRILSPVGMGKVSFATSLVSYFAMFAQLGIPTYGIRACAKVRDQKEELTRTVHELFFLNLITCGISYLFLMVILFTVPRFAAERQLYLLVSMTVLFQTIGMEWLYKALEEYTYITVRSVLFKVIALAAMFFLVREQSDYVLYGCVSIFAASASNIVNFIHARKYVGTKPVGNYCLKRHLKAVVIFFAMSCATVIYTNLDTVMLGFMKTDQDVGYYDAAIKIKTILVSIVTALGTVLLPRCAYYVENGRMDEFVSVCRKAMNFVILMAAPMVLYFVLFAKACIFFLAGEEYAGAILPMRLIMPTVLLIGVTNILGIQILVPMGKEKTVLYSEIAGAITDLIVNALLIPKFASSGAAIGTVAAELVVLAVQTAALRKEIRSLFGKIRFFKIAGALLAGAGASLWVLKIGAGSFLTLLLSGSLFWGVYGLVLLAEREPLVWELAKQGAGRIRGWRNRNV